MDQQAVKLLPKIEASKAYDKQKLQMLNYTIYDLSNKDAYNFWNYEDNGNLEASSYASMLLDFLEKNISIRKRIFLISDSCGYQNRNVVLSNALLRFSTKKKVNIHFKVE